MQIEFGVLDNFSKIRFFVLQWATAQKSVFFHDFLSKKSRFYLSKMWSFCTHFFVHLFCLFFKVFHDFLQYFCKRRSVEHAEFAIHLGCRNLCFCSFWHIYIRKIKLLTKFMTFYHAFSDNFRSFAYLHNCWTVRAVFSQTFFDIFPLFCVKNTKNMDYTKFEKGRCAP